MTGLGAWTEMAPAVVGYCLAAALIAGACRGFAGFGLSALLVTSLTLVLPPVEVVPIAVILETFSSVVMLRLTWSEIRWRLIGWLCLGAALGTPLGVYLLRVAPADAIRVAISLAVLSACLLLWRGLALTWRGDGRTVIGVGLVSGLANGAASLGGLPVAVFLLATAFSAAAIRASLNLYFLVLDIYGTAALGLGGLVTEVTLTRSALLALPVAVGIGLGHAGFQVASPATFRRVLLVLLASLSLAGLIRSIL